jgi:hypothetical protein
VCHFLYLIILVSYNLFRLFLVHKISAYKYIYENGEKKWEKKKKKEFPASWTGGKFRPTRARLRPSWPSCVGAMAGNDAVARAHMLERGRGLTALTAMEGGGVRPESGRR